MGQLLSRQASTTRSTLDREPLVTRSHHSRRERASNARLDEGREPPKSVHWDRHPTRTSKATGAQGSRACLTPLKEVDGNIGAPRRQPKYGRGKTSPEPSRTTNSGRQHIRKADIQQAKARTKEHHHTRSHASRSSLHQSQSRQTKECSICTDTRSLHRFPDRPPTERCSHDSDACRRCLRTWIHSEFTSKIWNEINCPICAARMQYGDIREFAPKEVFRRYIPPLHYAS